MVRIENRSWPSWVCFLSRINHLFFFGTSRGPPTDYFRVLSTDTKKNVNTSGIEKLWEEPYIWATLTSTFETFKFNRRNVFFPLQDKNEVADVGSLLTFDLSFSLPATGCTGLCPVLNSYLPDNYRGTVGFKFSVTSLLQWKYRAAKALIPTENRKAMSEKKF